MNETLVIPDTRLLPGLGLPPTNLPNAYGKSVSFADLVEGKIAVVTVLGVECPLAKLYAKRLKDLADGYAGRGVVFVAVDANRQDSLTEVAAFKRRYELDFPILKDNEAALVDWLGAERTPEAFVLDATGGVRYRGRIDDQYGVGYVRDDAEQHFVRDALEALLAGRPVSTPETDAVGCVIGRPRAPDESSPVTYANQVSRVLQKHCVECHRDGEIAPFTLTDYDEVVGWADTIAEVIRDQRMPPWHADPSVGHYEGERLMSDAEKQLVYEWVEHGAPEGDPAELPQPRTFVTGWRLPREPDLVLPMRSVPYLVPAEGVIEYQY
ncbi:MAG: redoxin domain-containing protein, partial [Planctomycetota bacterium]